MEFFCVTDWAEEVDDHKREIRALECEIRASFIREPFQRTEDRLNVLGVLERELHTAIGISRAI